MSEQRQIGRVRFLTLEDAKLGRNPIFPPVELGFAPTYQKSNEDWENAMWEVFYQPIPPRLLKTKTT